MPSPGFEPGSPPTQSKSDDLDRLAMGLAFICYEVYLCIIKKNKICFKPVEVEIWVFSIHRPSQDAGL